MKKYYIFFTFLMATLILFSGCDSSDDNTIDPIDQSDYKVTISGKVVDDSTNVGIQEAIVSFLRGSEQLEQVTTDAEGVYSTNIAIADSIVNDLKITAVKSGYSPAESQQLSVVTGRTYNIADLKLSKTGSVDVKSGNPASIYLVNQSLPSIGVKENGILPETAILEFEVQDSNGVAVDVSHSVTIAFKIGVTPGGGEYISPVSAKTNSEGRVMLTVTSGTKAGVLQVIPEIVFGPKLITAKPVSITIHGGLPDQNHFTIGPDKVNIPGWHVFNVQDQITVLIGDKYGNPVAPGTSVYFTTDGGVIQGSTKTNNDGQGTVTLFSGNPLPEHPQLGKGFATITAETADEQNNKVSGQTIVLFSGAPILTVQPEAGSDHIPQGGVQRFIYTLQDVNGNPMSSGQTVSVSIKGKSVDVDGDIDILMDDILSRGPGATEFSFFILDVNEEPDSTSRSVTVTVKTEGPNGRASSVLYTEVRP